ncbi:MAG: ABC transporter permease [Methylomonas sp.]|jgi:phospholipid/cholesterol/gamma-HCH transport system permease protein
MIDNSVEISSPPAIRIKGENSECLALKGYWNLRGLTMTPDLRIRTKAYAAGNIEWDLSEVEAMDSAGALILWQAWRESLPERIILRPEQEQLFLRMQQRRLPPAAIPPKPAPILLRTTRSINGFAMQILTWVALLGRLILDLFYLVRHPLEIPWKEISATIYETGGRALGITALVGFLIGIVVSYLSSLQLRTFGAAIFIVNILGLSIIRELGPLLAAILVAGRSGSAMTASLGVMRVTQELDALAAMGISQSQRLILPKVVALFIAMPLLVVWTDMIALIGGAMAAHMELEISMRQFLLKLPSAVPVSNFFIGLTKGAVFGLFIALIACHFGLRIKPDTESLGNETTNSVVVSITLVILLDAVFAIAFKGVGL